MHSENLSFKKVCLFCGRKNTSLRYSCGCLGESWQNQYRSLSVRLLPKKMERRAAVSSFHSYNTRQHPKGMLQYPLLPNTTYHSPELPATGLTPLWPLKHYTDAAAGKIYLKNEGDNPSGCFKDRETLMCLLNSRRRGLDKAVIYSSGNAAASAALFARKAGFHLITFVAGDTYQEKIEYIRRQGSEVVVIGNAGTNFEQGFRLFAELNARGIFARAGYDNWSVRNPYRVQGDKTIALEMVRQLEGEVPDYVIVPTANGSCLAGIWLGFKELHSLELITRLPAMISVGMKNANPVYKAVEKGILNRPVRCELGEVDPADAEMGSIILAEEGYDSIQAARAVVESGGLALEVKGEDTRDAMRELFQREEKLINEYSILPEPASLVSLAAVGRLYSMQKLSAQSRTVCVITGHGRKAGDKIREMMEEEDEIIEALDEVLETEGAGKKILKVKAGRALRVAADYQAMRHAFRELKN